MEKPQYDILISNISKEFGSATTTREKLKQFLISEFVCKNLIIKYSKIHSIRMPFGQEWKQQQYYFGFLTMVNTDVHDKLLMELNEQQLIFGDVMLKFDKAATYRVPQARTYAIDGDSETEEDFLSGEDYTGIQTSKIENEKELEKLKITTVEKASRETVEQRVSDREMELNQRQMKIEAKEKQQERKHDELQKKEIQLLQKEVEIKKKEQEVQTMLRKMDSLKDKTNLQQVNFEIIKLQVKKEAVENELKHWTMMKNKEEQKWKE